MNDVCMLCAGFNVCCLLAALSDRKYQSALVSLLSVVLCLVARYL